VLATIRPYSTIHSVFDWLDQLRQFHGLYFHAGTPSEVFEKIDLLLHGYEFALHFKGIVEAGIPTWGHFPGWYDLRIRKGSSVWSHKFVQSNPHLAVSESLEKFFEFVERYRRLRPVLVASVSLASHHSIFDQGCGFGDGSRRPAPRRIEVFRYSPDNLFFYREWHEPFFRDEQLDDDLQRVLNRVEGGYSIARDEWEWGHEGMPPDSSH
jgi:hypothetical protein